MRELMREALANQLDYVFLLRGLAFAFLAVTAFRLQILKNLGLSRTLLGWFGILHCLSEWLDLCAFSLGDTPGFAFVRVAIRTVSFVFLLEFGRQGLLANGLAAFKAWLYLPGLTLFLVFFHLETVVGFGGGNQLERFDAAGRHVFGFPSGLFAGWALWRAATAVPVDLRGALRFAGVCLAAYGSIVGLFPAQAAFFPAFDGLNAGNVSVGPDILLALLGFVCACAAVPGLWRVSRGLRNNNQQSRSLRRLLKPAVGLLLPLFGWWLTDTYGRTIDREMREDLLADAVEIAEAVDPALVKTLSFSAADRDKPEFQRLRGQFVAFGGFIRRRSIYSLALRDGKLTFGPENLAENSPLASPPGTIYKQPTKEAADVFLSGRAFVEGPVRDEYGEFVSAFAPVFDPQSSSVLMTVGLDEYAGHWTQIIRQGRFFPLCAVLCLSLILLVGFELMARRAGSAGESGRARRHIETVMFALCGLVLTFFIACVLQDAERRNRKRIFDEISAGKSALIDKSIGTIDATLLLLAHFIEHRDEISLAEYLRFSHSLAIGNQVKGFAWAPLVEAEQKEEFERTAARAGLKDFSIFELSPKGAKRPVGRRKVFLPLTFVTPQAGNESIVGFDLGSDPLRFAAIDEVLRTGLPAAAAPLILIDEQKQELSTILFRPVYAAIADGDPTRRSVRGLVFVALRLPSLVNAILCGSYAKDAYVCFDLAHLQNIENGAKPLWVASAPGHLHAATDAISATDESQLERVYPLFLCNQTFSLTAHPTAAFYADYPLRAWPLTCVLGTILTGLLTVFVGFFRERQAFLESEEARRTSSLRTSEEKQRILMEAIPNPVFFKDRDGFYRDCNEAFVKLLGKPKETIIGRFAFEIVPKELAKRFKDIEDVLYAAGGIQSYESPVRTADGDTRNYVFYKALVETMENTPLGLITVMADITERKRTEIRLHEMLAELEFRQAEISALLHASQAVATHSSFAAALKIIFSETKKVLGAAAGFAALPQTGERDLNILCADVGDGPCPLDSSSTMPLRGLCATARLSGRALYENDFVRERWLEVASSAHVNVKNMLVAPFLIAGKTRGFLAFANKPGGFEAQDLRIAEAMGEFAAISLKNAQDRGALAESEELFRTLAASAQDAIIMTEDGDRIVYWNQAAERIFGWKKEEALGRTTHNLLAPEDMRSFIQKQLVEFRASGQGGAMNRTLELPALCKDGTTITVELSLSALKKSGGGWRAVGIARDVTERKNMEKALRESGERYRSLVETAPVGIFVADPDTTLVLDVNTEGLAMTGKTLDEVIGRPAAELHPENERALFVRKFKDGISQTRSFTDILHLQRPDGTLRDVEISTCLTGVKRKLTVGIFHDVTERKRMERLLAAQRDAAFAVNESRHDDEVIAQVLQAVVKLQELDCAVFYQVNAAGGLDAKISSGLSVKLENDAAHFAPDSVPALWAREGKPFFAKADDPSSFPAACTAQGLKALAMIPVRWESQTFGVLNFGSKSLSEMPQALCDALTAIASNVGGVLFRLRAEASLRDSELKYRALFDGSTVGVALLDAVNGVFGDCNLHLALLLGACKEELFGKSLADISSADQPAGDSRERLIAAYLRQISSGESLTVPWRLVKTNGGELETELHLSPLTLAGKNIVQAVFVDVTQRRHAEAQLRLQSAALSAAAEGVVITDPQGTILWVNQAIAEMTGYETKELLGRNPRKFKSDRQDDAFYQDLWKVILRGDVWRGTLVNRRKDGSLYDEELTITPVRIESGEISHFIAIKRDITERKQQEAMLRENNRQLELAIERANQMALKAELANQTKSEFLANMSHEIRTPMNGLQGALHLLEDSGLDDEQRECVGTARGCSDALLTLLDDILDFSKIEAGRMSLENIDFDLRAVLESVTDVVALQAKNKGLRLSLVIPHALPVRLRGDPGRLRQILLNLAYNAVKFTERGGIEICVGSVAEVEDATQRATLRFAVKDTGIGIPADRKMELFRPFVQADAGNTRRFGGTGLGLAISKRLVELMGGSIMFESEEGSGSTFELTVSFERQSPPTVPAPKPTTDLRGVRILLADNDCAARSAVSESLCVLGCRVDAAEDGDAALAQLKAAALAGDAYRVLIADAELPRLRGKSLGRAVKEDVQTQNTVLVAITAFGARGDAAKMREAGFAAYLPKPIKLADLRDALMLSLGGPQAPVVSPPPLVTRHSLAEGRRALRILAAEDNEVNRRILLKMLDKLGYAAEAVVNGRLAVEAYRAAPFDLILMDIQMPEKDGFEATAAIRELERGTQRRAYVAALTAHALKGTRELCLEHDLDDYLSKPISPEALAALLARAVNSLEQAD
jgi:PAS domain S-box-containing protein